MLQGTEEWRLARCGSLGASSMHEAMAKIKTGWGASRANLMGRLIAERLTGVPQDGYSNAAMQWGTDVEPEARAAYAFMRDADVTEIAIVLHPTIAGSHASPDGLVGEAGLVEIKCPNVATHIETLLTGAIAEKYVIQTQWQMACTGRKWADFVSYDPRMPEEMQLFIKRIHRDDKRIAEMEACAVEFILEMEDKIARLKAAVGMAEAA